ncbi:MAG: Cof-type HAD-IIB family hydrolase [Bacillota bacterium]|nr:Cof-type HAD-IIB family hydrolase [Bacillota bacterium]
MKYKYLFMDLDETSLIDHHVSKENQEAIKKAQEKGVHIIPCTGRDLSMIQEILEEIETRGKENEFSICCNGAMVKENTGKVVFYKGIETNLVKEFLSFAQQVTGVVFIFAQEGIHIFRPNDFEVQRKIKQNSNPIIHKDFEVDFSSWHVIKMMISESEPLLQKQILESIPSKILDNCQITVSSGRYIEFNGKGVHKGNGIQALMEYLKDSIDTCIAIGDHFNDLEMIQMAGLGCAVANAIEENKAVADYVCENDYTNHAVKEVIEKFIL